MSNKEAEQYEDKDKRFTITITAYPKGIKRSFEVHNDNKITIHEHLGVVEYYKTSIINAQGAINIPEYLAKEIDKLKKEIEELKKKMI